MENYNQTSGNNNNQRMNQQSDQNRVNQNIQESQSQDNERDNRMDQQSDQPRRNQNQSMQENQSHNYDEQNDDMQRSRSQKKPVYIQDMPEIKPDVNEGGI